MSLRTTRRKLKVRDVDGINEIQILVLRRLKKESNSDQLYINVRMSGGANTRNGWRRKINGKSENMYKET